MTDMNQQTNNKPIYLSGLNGIRAIAALGVLISHINLSLEGFKISTFSLFGFNDSNKQMSWSLGEQGVTMFFVLSGFLITYLLVLEQNKNSTIKRKDFYIRRILRIWPLYFFYLITSIIAVFFLTNDLPGLGIVSLYVFLLANVPFIIGKGMVACSHLWSIAVEEQFYLFWPLFFYKRINIEKALILIIISAVVIRIALWFFYPFQTFTILFTVNRFDCMMFGGLIAIWIHKKSPFISIILSKPARILSWILIAILIFNKEILNSIITLELITLATGIIICEQVLSKHKVINLENKLFNFLGKYSYGIYVYHPLLIFCLAKSNVFLLIDNQVIRGGLFF